MTLTPEDVSTKRFTPVRLREGYDMGEVDQFLDEVEAELRRLLTEKEEMRSPRATSQVAAAEAPSGTTPGKQAEQQAGEAGEEPEDHTPGTPSSTTEAITVTTAPQASHAAARLLEIATRNADELVEEAQGQAENIVGSARSSAERLESESKEKAEQLESDARQRSLMLDQETAERRQQLFSELELERDRLSAEVDDLRAFEREYRSRLKSYFTQQLQLLDGVDLEGDASGQGDNADSSGGLKSVLGDD